MSKSTKPSPSRLKEILRRQDPPGFGRNYIPSIKATREEAPPKSRPAWVWWDVVGRDLSTLSSVERAVLFIALHNNKVWEVQDQRMLPPMPRPHPMSGHPKAVGLQLPSMRGTLDVADSLGLFRYHPRIRVPAEDNSGGFEFVPFPWVGDLLLFLDDDLGPYNVNLNIKADPKEFEHSEINGALRGRRAEKSQEKTRARHAIEAQLYSDIGIRTVQLSTRDYDEHVVANLTQFHLWHHRASPFREAQREEIIGNLKTSLVTGDPVIEVLWSLCAKYGWKLDDVKVVMYQALQRRLIRIDLFQPFMIDAPFQLERRDVLSVYSNWFKR